MTDFADELGPAYTNLIIRRLGQRLAAAGEQHLGQSDMAIPARATAVTAYLWHHNSTSIASIADALGYSHQTVTKSVELLEKDGFAESSASEKDLRVRSISLTPEGRAQAKKMMALTDKFREAFESIFDETGVDLFRAIRRFEKALDERSFSDRLT